MAEGISKKEKETAFALAFLEVASPLVSATLRRYQSRLRIEQRYHVFGILQQLVRNAPDRAWRELDLHPDRFGRSYREDEKLLRSLARRKGLLCGVRSSKIVCLVEYLDEAVADCGPLEDLEAEALGFYRSRLVETAGYLIRHRRRHLTIVHSAAAPSAFRASRHRIRHPGEGGKPVLRLIKSRR